MLKNWLCAGVTFETQPLEEEGSQPLSELSLSSQCKEIGIEIDDEVFFMSRFLTKNKVL